MRTFDNFTRSHLKKWLHHKLSPDANLDSFVVLIEEWVSKQDQPQYWLEQGWSRIWEQFVKDEGLKGYTE